MDITEEMLSAGAKLIAEEHGSEVFWPDHEPNEYTDVEREQYRAEARAVIELVAPLIAAQALRSGKFEYAAKVTFRDGSDLIDTARTTSLPMAHHRAATIRAQYPPSEVPDSEDVVGVEVLRRTIGQWEPVP